MKKPRQKDKYGKCALYLVEGKLCYSHIIPEFFYKPFYQQGKREFWGLSTKKGDRVLTFKKGIREYLLSQKAEEHFSRWETYAANIFFGDGIAPPKVEGDQFIFEDLDYKKLKLFFMSVLWKMSASKNNSFSNIKLGSHQEKIRKMLIDSDPGQFWQYPCFITAITFNGKFNPDFHLSAVKVRYEKSYIWKFVMGGYLFGFVIVSDREKLAELGEQYVLSEHGHLIVWKKEFSDIRYLFQAAKRMIEANPDEFKD